MSENADKTPKPSSSLSERWRDKDLMDIAVEVGIAIIVLAITVRIALGILGIDL